MKRLAPVLTIIALLFACATVDARPAHRPRPTPTPTPIPTTALTFDDEFDGTLARWSSLYGLGDPGDRLDSDDMGDLRQVSVANSIATITVERATTPSGRSYASASMRTAFSQRYGTWEARIRWDEATGTWPSLWMLPSNWPASLLPETDWLEAYGCPASLGPGLVEHVVHAVDGTTQYVIRDWGPGFHVVKLVWTATRMDFSIDGTPTWSVTDKVPQVAMFPIVQYGVGATGCRVDSTTPSTLTLDIDYLRVAA